MTPEEIKAIRLDAGLSRAEFARLLEVSPQSVSLWERGGCSVNTFNERKILNTAKKIKDKRILENVEKLGTILDALADDVAGRGVLKMELSWINGQEVLGDE